MWWSENSRLTQCCNKSTAAPYLVEDVVNLFLAFQEFDLLLENIDLVCPKSFLNSVSSLWVFSDCPSSRVCPGKEAGLSSKEKAAKGEEEVSSSITPLRRCKLICDIRYRCCMRLTLF
jgi:hypothetical protein